MSGGRLDATNIVRRPCVTAVTRLDYDHVQVLGDTLTLIAGEKAGIFKKGVPAITMDQEAEAMDALKAHAETAGVTLFKAPPVGALLGAAEGGPVVIGLEGEHHNQNAAVAVALCNAWVARKDATAALPPLEPRPLPLVREEPVYLPGAPEVTEAMDVATLFQLQPTYRAGLAACAESWYGRSQVLSYPVGEGGEVTMMLDGAHTPDSIRAMGQWYYSKAAEINAATTVLLCFIGAERDPADLLTVLKQTQVESESPHFDKVFFTVNNFHPSRRGDQADLSWQETLAAAWVSERVAGGGEVTLMPCAADALDEISALAEGGGVQVLVTGSVLLVGGAISGLFLRICRTFWAHFTAVPATDLLGELGGRGHWSPSYPGGAVGALYI